MKKFVKRNASMENAITEFVYAKKALEVKSAIYLPAKKSAILMDCVIMESAYAQKDTKEKTVVLGMF
jgi:hypothetical protein